MLLAAVAAGTASVPSRRLERRRAEGAALAPSSLLSEPLGAASAAHVAAAAGSSNASNWLAARIRKQPHIVVYMADDLGFEDTGFGGSSIIQTPFLDRLASEAVHLTSFRTSAWCAPARSAFLTGRHEWELGTYFTDEVTLMGEAVFLSELLHDLGYHTAIAGKWHFKMHTCELRQRELYPERPNGGAFGCGFDHQYGALGGHIGYYDRKSSRWSRDGKRIHQQGYSPDLIAAETVRIIDEHAASPEWRERPLFLWHATNAPHIHGEAGGQPWTGKPELLEHFSHVCESGCDEVSGAALDTRHYAAVVLAMDQAFEATNRAMSRHGMLADALQVFLSDNGGPCHTSLCNRGLRGCKSTGFEGGHRAPALLHFPTLLGTERRRSSAPVHMVDFFATLVEAAAATQGSDGRRALVSARQAAPSSVSMWRQLDAARSFTEAPPHGGALAERVLVTQVAPATASVVQGNSYALVLTSNACSRANSTADMYRYVPLQRSHGSEEKVFDLRRDPEQRTNIRHTPRGKFVAARLGHRYDAARSEALRMRNKAIAEGRMKGPNQGKGVVLPPHEYFCVHVRDAWFDETWSKVQGNMCLGRRDEERTCAVESYCGGAEG